MMKKIITVDAVNCLYYVKEYHNLVGLTLKRKASAFAAPWSFLF